MKAGKQTQEMEIGRRIRLRWEAYGKIKYIFSMNISINLKTKVYNKCVLRPTYACDTWVITRNINNILKDEF